MALKHLLICCGCLDTCRQQGSGVPSSALNNAQLRPVLCNKDDELPPSEATALPATRRMRCKKQMPNPVCNAKPPKCNRSRMSR